MEALHVRLKAFSAAYPYPFLRSGTQLSLPAPPFSSILGNISACAGRVVGPAETLIGMEFEQAGQGIDLERTRRLRTDKKSGRLSENPERGIAKRQFHVLPCLNLYLSALGLEDAFLRPAETPCMGRSQDIAWICSVSRIELVPTNSGRLGPTLVRFPNTQVGGLILPPLADYYINDDLGHIRRAGRYTRYQYVPRGASVRATADFNLYHPSDSDSPDHVVTLHQLTQ
jgi:CRISPR-associated protein Cas5t